MMPVLYISNQGRLAVHNDLKPLCLPALGISMCMYVRVSLSLCVTLKSTHHIYLLMSISEV
jgi:hypothetical protein